MFPFWPSFPLSTFTHTMPAKRFLPLPQSPLRLKAPSFDSFMTSPYFYLGFYSSVTSLHRAFPPSPPYKTASYNLFNHLNPTSFQSCFFIAQILLECARFCSDVDKRGKKNPFLSWCLLATGRDTISKQIK
jgi:hypothetical protein